MHFLISLLAIGTLTFSSAMSFAEGYQETLRCSDDTHTMTITNSDFVEQIAASGSYIAQTDEGTARWLAHDLVEVTIFTQTFYDLPPHRLAYPIVKNLHIAPDRKSVSFENEAPIQCTAL